MRRRLSKLFNMAPQPAAFAAASARAIRLTGTALLSIRQEWKIVEHSENRVPWGKVIAMAAIAAVVSAVACALVQQLIVGNVNAAVTGGVTGGVVGAIVPTILSRKSRSTRK